MAQRRMFARRIIDSDSFTDMPLSSQALYFHIAMNADDDGFVDGVRRIRRCIGASEDDLKLLIAKRFLIPFESGVVVVRQWHVHNYIQKDRYKPTVHTAEKRQLVTDDGRCGEKDAYVLKGECPALSEPETPVLTGHPGDVSEMDTERIQNVSPGKVRDRDRVRLEIERENEEEEESGGDARARACAEIRQAWSYYLGREAPVQVVRNIADQLERCGFEDAEGIAAEAIALAAGRETGSPADYVRKVLGDWAQHHVRTLAQAIEYQALRDMAAGKVGPGPSASAEEKIRRLEKQTFEEVDREDDARRARKMVEAALERMEGSP